MNITSGTSVYFCSGTGYSNVNSDQYNSILPFRYWVSIYFDKQGKCPEVSLITYLNGTSFFDKLR